MSESQISKRSYAILILLAVIWGSSFILIKKSLIAFDPIHLAAMRLVIAGGAFLPILVYQWKKIDWSLWPIYVGVSLTGSGIPAFMFFIAQTEISSSISGLLNSLTPIWTLVLGIAIFKQPFIKGKLLGVLIGLMGAIILITFGEEVGIEGNLWYGGFILIATICYGTSVNLVKNFLQNVPSLVISSVTLAGSGFIAFLYLLTTNVNESFTGTTEMWYSLWSLILLSIASTFFATIIFYRLVKDTDAVFASSVTYLIPIVALFWGFLDGEVLTILHGLGMVLILLGVWIIKRK